jgi:putative membrane protein
LTRAPAGARLRRVLVAAAVAAAAAPADAQYYGDHPHFWGGWGMMLGPLVMLVFVAVTVAVVVFLVRAFGGGSRRSTRGSKTPVEILEERFARGEIDEEEFKQRKRALTE